MLSTALVPFMPEPWMAAAAICISFLVASAWGVNLYTIPVDLFGHRSAGFAVSLLTAAYGLLQVVVSPLIGQTVREQGFKPVCLVAAVCPLVAYGILVYMRARHGGETKAQAVAV
jgi:predicted MFS family arabinose efflux permease